MSQRSSSRWVARRIVENRGERRHFHLQPVNAERLLLRREEQHAWFTKSVRGDEDERNAHVQPVVLAMVA